MARAAWAFHPGPDQPDLGRLTEEVIAALRPWFEADLYDGGGDVLSAGHAALKALMLAAARSRRLDLAQSIAEHAVSLGQREADLWRARQDPQNPGTHALLSASNHVADLVPSLLTGRRWDALAHALQRLATLTEAVLDAPVSDERDVEVQAVARTTEREAIAAVLATPDLPEDQRIWCTAREAALVS